jgi:hypothetical protein
MATLSPASDRRLAAQPPEAPEPTTRTSKFVGESGVGICSEVAIVGDRTQYATRWMLASGDDDVKERKWILRARKFCWTGAASGTIGGGFVGFLQDWQVDERSVRIGVRTQMAT